MLQRQTSGSVVCPTCGRLVGVNDRRCFSCGRWNPGLWGWAPLLSKLGRDLGFVPMVWGGCGLVYLAMLFFDPSRLMEGGLFGILSPSQRALLVFGASGAVPLFGYGNWWSLLAAAWLHGGLLHIVFNMMALRQLAPPVAELFGLGRLVIIYVVSSATGFALTSFVGLLGLPGILSGAMFTVGASASLFGLLGALILYSQRTGQRQRTDELLRFVVIWVIIGLVVPLIDNWAHLGGFAGGYLAARWLDPLREETQGHLLAALVCLALSALSVVVSIFTGLRLLAEQG